MGRRPAHVPLHVYLNDRHVGVLSKAASGAVAFAYDDEWLTWEHALPVSLSLPLTERRHVGAAVIAAFENLLPDFEPLRRRIAERVGARGTDAYSLLARIGRDCVGALQFLPPGDQPTPIQEITGAPLDEAAIAELLANLSRAPLGLNLADDDSFRISLAGAQEKTALLRHDGGWLRPHGTTPTTHILKPEIKVPSGSLGLPDSVENEFYCMKLIEALGFPTAACEIRTFGGVKTLVVERFDRLHTRDGRLLRVPQEDCCQALSVPPTMKYQSEGGPGIVAIMELLNGSDDAVNDRLTFFRAQIAFWLIGATDGHAKNFSLFLRPGGGFRMTPLYDILSTQPMVDAGLIERNAFKLSMAVGNSGKYRVEEIHGRHFLETGRACGLSTAQITQSIDAVREQLEPAFETVGANLPSGFPLAVVDSIEAGARKRGERLATA